MANTATMSKVTEETAGRLYVQDGRLLPGATAYEDVALTGKQKFDRASNVFKYTYSHSLSGDNNVFSAKAFLDTWKEYSRYYNNALCNTVQSSRFREKVKCFIAESEQDIAAGVKLDLDVVSRLVALDPPLLLEASAPLQISVMQIRRAFTAGERVPRLKDFDGNEALLAETLMADVDEVWQSQYVDRYCGPTPRDPEMRHIFNSFKSGCCFGRFCKGYACWCF